MTTTVTAHIESNCTWNQITLLWNHCLSYFFTTKWVCIIHPSYNYHLFPLKYLTVTYTITIYFPFLYPRELHPLVPLEDACRDYTRLESYFPATLDTFSVVILSPLSNKHFKLSSSLSSPLSSFPELPSTSPRFYFPVVTFIFLIVRAIVLFFYLYFFIFDVRNCCLVFCIAVLSWTVIPTNFYPSWQKHSDLPPHKKEPSH